MPPVPSSTSVSCSPCIDLTGNRHSAATEPTCVLLGITPPPIPDGPHPVTAGQSPVSGSLVDSGPLPRMNSDLEVPMRRDRNIARHPRLARAAAALAAVAATLTTGLAVSARQAGAGDDA